ncbi:hypothetical protein, partial [Segatella oulorum]|uniref:hypothetical protein n=1 Tax=Segatella oulorum TaxID=28136 RepID=UPI0028E34EDB
RNSSYCPPNRLLQGATAHFAPLLARNKLWLQSFKCHFYNLFILLLSLQKFLKEVYEERIQFSMLRGFISVVGLSFQEE